MCSLIPLAEWTTMLDKLTISLGSWATVQAEGLFALGATLLIAAYFGALWFAAWWLISKTSRSH